MESRETPTGAAADLSDQQLAPPAPEPAPQLDALQPPVFLSDPSNTLGNAMLALIALRNSLSTLPAEQRESAGARLAHALDTTLPLLRQIKALVDENGLTLAPLPEEAPDVKNPPAGKSPQELGPLALEAAMAWVRAAYRGIAEERARAQAERRELEAMLAEDAGQARRSPPDRPAEQAPDAAPQTAGHRDSTNGTATARAIYKQLLAVDGHLTKR